MFVLGYILVKKILEVNCDCGICLLLLYSSIWRICFDIFRMELILCKLKCEDIFYIVCYLGYIRNDYLV